MERSIINNYEILDEIGNGGFSVVYLGKNTTNQKVVALKIIDRKLANNEKFKERFRYSTKILFQLQHPNIVKIEDLIDTPSDLVLVMEYVDGIKLDDFIIKNYKPSDPLILLPFFYQLLDAVEYAHSNNIIHRDIKPSNVLIAKDGNLKLIGFDVLKDLNTNSDPTSNSSYSYMSPEQLVSSKLVNQQSDIYSLGILLYYLLTGDPLYDKDEKQNISILAAKIKTLPIPKLSFINPNIPEVFDFIIAKATEKQPERRFFSCTEFKNHLINKTKPTQIAENIDIDKTIVNFNSTFDSDKTIIISQQKSGSNEDKLHFFDNSSTINNRLGEEKTQLFGDDFNINGRFETEKNIRSPKEEIEDGKTQLFGANSQIYDEKTQIFKNNTFQTNQSFNDFDQKEQFPQRNQPKKNSLSIGDKIYFIVAVIVFILGIVFLILKKLK